MLTPTVRRTLAPRGKTPIIRSGDRHDRISAISAGMVGPKRRRLGLYLHVLSEDPNAHREDAVAFLRQLRRHVPGPMTVLWDRANIHNRSKVVPAYLAKHPEVVTEKFPGDEPGRDGAGAYEARPPFQLHPRGYRRIANDIGRGAGAGAPQS